MKNTNNTLILAHAGGSPKFPENSVLAIEDGLKYNPDLVEIDVRMSLDGVIYCYHWPKIIYPIFHLFAFLPFRFIHILTGADTLERCLGIFRWKKTGVFLDFKQHNIHPNRIEALRKQFDIENVWIGSRKLAFLKKFKNMFWSQHYTYLFNFNSFYPRKTIDILSGIGIDAMKFFHWQTTHENVEYANSRNIGCIYDRKWYFWGEFPKAPHKNLQSLIIWYNDMSKKI